MTLEAVAIAANVPHDISHPVSNNGTTRYVYAPEMFGKQFIVEQIKSALNIGSCVETLIITTNSFVALNVVGHHIEEKNIDFSNAIINISGEQYGFHESGWLSAGWPFGLYDLEY